jgi:hypothetical protein
MVPGEDGDDRLETLRPEGDSHARRSCWLPTSLDPTRSEEGGEPDWVRGLTKTGAEELLDWLEAHGIVGEVLYEDGTGFAVRPVITREAGRAGGEEVLHVDGEHE